MADPIESHVVTTLGTHLADLGIKVVAIIDDAYDVPSLANLNQGEIESFWGAIDRLDNVIDALAQLTDVQVSCSADITNEVIDKLWDTYNAPTDLAEYARNTLFSTVLEKRTEVDLLENNLIALGIDVVRLGSDGDYPDPTIRLVFIDYFLGSTADAVTAAKVRAREIYDRGQGPDKPFIVLMSSESFVENHKESFRDDSGLLAGLYDFAHKLELCNPKQLNIKLATWALGLPVRHTIQRFVEALSESVRDVAKSFMTTVRGLGLEDYAYIQRIALRKDGHPLGDYMLWLFTTLLSHQAFERNDKVKEQRRELDKLAFTELLPCTWKPSSQLIEVYGLALADPEVEELAPHPLDGMRATPNNLPYLQMGDILISPDKKLQLVANAACDLAFAPGTDRDDPDRSVLLIPGEVVSEGTKAKDGELVTDVFMSEGKPYSILWKCKHARLERHGDFGDMVAKNKYSRKARLRLPYVLQVQQEYAANLTRVGMPVRPPRNEIMAVEVFFEGGEANHYVPLREQINDGVRIIYARDGNYFHLTIECVAALMADLDRVIDAQLERRNREESMKSKGWENRVKGIDSRLQRLREFASEHSFWMRLVREPREYSTRKHDIVPNVLELLWNRVHTDIAASNSPIVLNARSRLPAENANQVSVESAEGDSNGTLPQ